MHIFQKIGNPIRKSQVDDFGKDDFIWARRNFLPAAFAAFVLWAIVILQTVLTRWYVSQTAFEQAFAKVTL